MQNGIIPSRADLHYLFCANRQFFDNGKSKNLYDMKRFQVMELFVLEFQRD